MNRCYPTASQTRLWVRCLLTLPILLFFAVIPARAQHDGVISGRLDDTVTHAPVPDATITILNLRDSALVAFTRCGASGSFRVGALAKGSYRLLVTHVGYRNLNRVFVLTDLIREIDLGKLPMIPRAGLLDPVTVEQEAPPVALRHDTIEYNAGSFKVKQEAVVEDLLKKMPGLQVDKNGTIKANGEEVKKVLVDGKEFFGTDPKIASKNLPADAVDKVQVFDKRSDQSQFTGFDDGNSQKTINLTIKKDKKHGVFGKAVAGMGSDAHPSQSSVKDATPATLPGQYPADTRFENNFTLNQFHDKQQLSVMGMANNTNKQGFSFQDVLGFNGGLIVLPGSGSNSGRAGSANPFNAGIPVQGLSGNNQAVTTTKAGGLNYNDEWNGHTDIHASFFYNHTDDRSDLRDTRSYLAPENSYMQDQLSSTRQHNGNQRFHLIADHRIDTASSLKFTSTLTWQQSSAATGAIDTSRSLSDGSLLNHGSSMTSANLNGYDWDASALFRHRFAKKGRTVSANLSIGINNSAGGGMLHSANSYTPIGGPSSTDSLNQAYTLPSLGNNYGISLVYTEPISRTNLLAMNAGFYQTDSRSTKQTFDADSTGKYTRPDVPLTNDFDNRYSYEREGIQWQIQRRKWNLTAGANLQQAVTRSHFGYLTGDSLVTRNYFNILPGANAQYVFNAYRNLRLIYNTFTNPPSLTQLQPVPDNSDPLNIRVGNPRLKQEYYHSLRLHYLSFDPFRRTSFFAMLGYTGIHDRIVNDVGLGTNGAQVIRPANLDGLFRMNANTNWQFPVRPLKASLSFSSSLDYDHNAGLVNGVRNDSRNWTVGEGANLNIVPGDRYDVTAGVKEEYNDVHYSLFAAQDQTYWTEEYTLEVNAYLRERLSLASDIDYIHRSGLPAGYNSSPLIWNAGLAEKLFRNKKGVLRLQVFDILSRNTGFTRNTSQNYIEDISYRVLNRYWLLSFTYNISRFAGKNIQGRDPDKVDIKFVR